MADLRKQDVFEQLSDRKDKVFRRLHQEMGYDEDILEASALFQDKKIMKFLRGFPEGFVAKVPSLAKDVIDVGVNRILTGQTPIVNHLLPPGTHVDEAKAKEHKTDLDRKAAALLWYIETSASETPFRGMVQHALGLGLGVIAYPILWQKWPDHPFTLKNGKTRAPRNAREAATLRKWQRNRQNRIPFEVRVVHPRSALFDPYHDPIENMIEYQEVAPAAYAKDYPHLNIPARATTKASKLVTYVDPDWYGMWLDGRPLLTPEDGADGDGIAPNTTGVLWYKMARGGFGERTYRGEWEYAIKGMLRDGRDMLLGHITTYNIFEEMLKNYAFTPLDVEGPDEETARAQAPRSFGPGVIWAHDRRVSAKPMAPPQPPQMALTHGEQQDQELGIHFGPYGDALRGQYRSETASGLRTRLSVSESPYMPARQNTQQATSMFLQDIYWYTKHVLQEQWSIPSADAIVSLAPEDIPDGVRVNVNWAPPSKEEKAMALQDLLQQKQQNAASIRRILEADDSVEDVDEELAQIAADMALPGVIQLIAQQAAQQVQGKAVQQPQASPQQGAPPGPEVAAPAAGGGFTRPGEQPPPAILGGATDMNQNLPRYTLPKSA